MRIEMRERGLNLSSWRQIAAVAFLAMSASSAVVAQKVISDYDKTTDFSSFKTYGWGENTSLLDPKVNQEIKVAIEADLDSKGLKKVPGEVAELLVGYQAATNTDLNVSGFVDPTYSTMGGTPMVGTTVWSSGSTAGSVGRYIGKGSLAIQVYDRRQRKVIWQAVAKGTLKEKRIERMDQLNNALTKMMARYPPGKK